MKKIIAIAFSLIFVLTCFAGCKGKLKDGTVVTNAAGDNIAAVTGADGGIKRDEAGNLIALVTDKNGKNVKGDNGEYLTKPVALEHALVIGNRVECNEYSVLIPNGWSDAISLNGLSITKDGTMDSLVIEKKDSSLDKAMKNTITLLGATRNMYENTVYVNKAITIGGIEAHLLSVYIPDNGKTPESGLPSSSYLGYIFFEQGSNVYSCRISSDRDMSDALGEITDIIESIKFYE